MAINILSANLNTYGDKGNFETDPSTWGFGSDDFRSYSRSSTYKTKNIYSCKTTFLKKVGTGGQFSLCSAQLAVTAGKKYIAYAKIRTTDGMPIGASTATLYIDEVSSALTRTEHSFKIVSEIKAGFVQIYAKFDASASSTSAPIRLYINDEDSAFVNGELYIDEFELYEYEEVVLACTLQVDEANVVVADESAKDAADGSITGAVIGANDATSVEYSIDNVTWQSSNLFSGLSAKGYTLYVREPDGAGGYCTDNYKVVVNYAGTPVSFTAETTDESLSGAADGSMTITPAGGTSPYTYSKDNGATSQTNNKFSGLSGGIYFVKVTDSAGAYRYELVTIATLAESYQKAYFSKSPIPLTLSETANAAENNYRIYVDVRVEDTPGSGEYISKFVTAQEPDSKGKAKFNLRPAFRDVFSPVAPLGSSDKIIKVMGNKRLYRAYYGDIFNDMTVPASFSSTNPFMVVLGGIDKRRWPAEDYFTEHLPNYERPMTWSPPEKQIDRGRNDWLYFFNYDTTVYTVRSRAVVYYTDGTSSVETNLTATGLAVEKGDIVRVNAGPANSGVLDIDATKIIRYYELWLIDQDGAQVMEKRRYHVQQYKSPDTKYILFQNSLGAFDLLRVTGRTVFQPQVERMLSQRYLATDYDPEKGEFLNYQSRVQGRKAYSTGFFSGKYAKYMAKYMQELFLSAAVYDVTDNSLVPIVLDGNSLRITDGDYKYFARFEAMDGFSNSVFTPEEFPEQL